MRGSFAERLDVLSEHVGDGDLVGKVGFSPGKIAGPQHLGGWITGPLAGVKIRNYTTPGTGSRYLEDPLLENFERYMAKMAGNILLAGPRDTMQEITTDLLRISRTRIPRKTGELARSGRTVVIG